MLPAQIRGLLLEEAMLHLLRSAAYVPVLAKGVDSTLEQKGLSLFVKGRGESHQVDAIADYRIQPAFSNPQRLLVEAKFYEGRQVGLSVIRNAVGVLNDVSQFFIASPRHTPSRVRYHYQYAVVSATKFSVSSQRYAYAHDVSLIPLGGSIFFRRLLNSIRDAADAVAVSSENQDSNDFSGALRQRVRTLLANNMVRPDRGGDEADLGGFVQACSELGFGLIAVTPNGFPLFLVPTAGLELSEIEDNVRVRIHRNVEGWYLADRRGRQLFSFDVPVQLLELYADGGEITAQRALDLKQQELHSVRAVVAEGDSIRIVRFVLDIPWLEAIRVGL